MKYIVNNSLKTHRATAQADCCGDTIISNHGGMFVTCKCGMSFIDQDRQGIYIRLGGKANLVSAECPLGCKIKHI